MQETTDAWKTETPPFMERWNYTLHEERGGDIPELLARFENRWRVEIKEIDGDTYYNLHVPLEELDEWESGGQVEDWSFLPFDRIVSDLWQTLNEIDNLSELKEAGDSDVTFEYGMIFEMLEREDL